VSVKVNDNEVFFCQIKYPVRRYKNTIASRLQKKFKVHQSPHVYQVYKTLQFSLKVGSSMASYESFVLLALIASGLYYLLFSSKRKFKYPPGLICRNNFNN